MFWVFLSYTYNFLFTPRQEPLHCNRRSRCDCRAHSSEIAAAAITGAAPLQLPKPPQSQELLQWWGQLPCNRWSCAGFTPLQLLEPLRSQGPLLCNRWSRCDRRGHPTAIEGAAAIAGATPLQSLELLQFCNHWSCCNSAIAGAAVIAGATPLQSLEPLRLQGPLSCCNCRVHSTAITRAAAIAGIAGAAIAGADYTGGWELLHGEPMRCTRDQCDKYLIYL